MRRLRILLSAAVIATTLATTLTLASRGDTADAAIGPVTWSDEFNGAAGAAVDGSKWNFDVGGGGFGNSELQYYTNSTNNVRQDGAGRLAITARKENPANYQCWYGTCQYTSGRLLTSGKFTQKYGRFEASIKVPKGQGIWPAFWMLGDNLGSVGWPQSGEIDIMENVGKEPNTLYGTVHGPGYSGGSAISGSRTLGAPLGDAFHTYAVEWSPNLIVWFLDGVEYHRVTPATLGGRQWVFDHPFFLILNVAVGGNWPGSPDASTSFPQTMLVDYVRASAWNEDTATGSALKSTFSGRCIDIPNGNSADGTRIQMWDCNGSTAQRWTFAADGTLRALGKCFDPAGGALANGTPIQLVTCNGNPVQRFTLSAAGDLVNVSANRCVDIKDWNAGNGAQLQLWDCGGGTNQKWTRA
ncbi:beta-glucanase (GH16 family) [Actinoplanes lutulentus]|uniref:Beta-glucanase (GH16 family) n=1 Tax=Actinoplanes lutulentus TaxID=1287878 RepID=A0A327Z9D0_9ACTN|nr:glycoside hydrolase family 16 protein [Actinoplanes lutulentus]MBB2946172.1 beta-glucanase (GH16 family) [Actinoplanes lutulentus]RAK32861.1 beta-glucanase (GH16 family) [Actinoplanes lutulentus]